MLRIGLTLTVCLASATVLAAAGTWDLSTDDSRAVVGVSNRQLVLTQLGQPGDRTNWLSSEAAVPLMARVWVGSREVPTHWVFQEAARAPQSETLTLVFSNADPKLILRSIWRARAGRGPIEHWMEIENRSGRRVTVAHQDSLSLRGLSPSGAADLWWIQRGGSNASTQGGTFHQPLEPKLNLTLASNCEDGASPVPWLAVQAGQERGLYVGWEFSGLGRIHARAGKNPGQLDIDVGNHPDFKTDVEPGEVFLAPPAFVGCYRGDLDEGSYSLHRFVLEKLRPPCPGPDPILAYNLYLDVGGNTAKEADVLRSARTCRELGFEAFMPDAMWFPETGDWRWDPQRFPNGVGPIEGYVHGQGMKMALWCAWTNGGVSTGPGALSVRGTAGKPEWFNADVGPGWKPGPFYGAQLCLGCPEAKAWEVQKTQWLVGYHKLDYLKHDCGPIVTACNKTTHRHHHGVDASYWATLGYYEVQEKLRKAFPQVILENCSGGGHIKDFGVIRRTHYTVTTDTLSNLPNRQGMYDSTFALPPMVLQCYTYDNQYPVKGDEPDTFLWRSAMMGAWQIDPTDTPRWTEAQRHSASRSVQIYKEWIRPMLQDVKVHHILPRPDGIRWDGLFYWSPPLRRGTLSICRPESPHERQTVKLKGLQPEGRYWLWCEDGSIEPGIRGGKELMERGLAIGLPQPYSSDLIFFQDEALGKPRGLETPGEFRLKPPQVKAGPFAVSATLHWDPSAGATSFRVIASERADFGSVVARAVVSGPTATLEDLPPGRQLYWRVEAVSWGGRRANSGGPGSLITPPRTPLAGIAFLSDMPWVKATAGADNPVRRDKNYYGKPISIAGTAYPKGLWTHAFPDATPADVVIDLSGKRFAAFRADAGLDDASGAGSVQFQVLVDGQLKAESPLLRPRQVHRFHVDVTGAKQLVLRVLNGGDGHSCDHAAWGFARLVEPGAADPLDKGK
jgi:hypothetical protein